MTDQLIVYSKSPYNAEPSLARLRASYKTPQADFYVRCHGNVPQVSLETFALAVDGLVAKPLRLSMEDLAAFAERSVEAVMQCAGNRRADMHAMRPVSGDPWDAGAIGNAKWSGVSLAEVLDAAGIDRKRARHVAFHALDDCKVDDKRFRYGASIPIEKALSGDVLLANAMNDEPLAPEHGFPLRVVVPGYAGVRSPKWLCRIEVSDRPSDCPIQAADYKMLPPDITSTDNIDWTRGVTINELPVNSAICEPPAHAQLLAGPSTLRGWAMATGRAIPRVDVSVDGGHSWHQAQVESAPSPWSWTFWSSEVELPAGEHELVVRAWDDAGQTQPSSPGDTWNVKGYLSAAWHRVPVSVRRRDH